MEHEPFQSFPLGRSSDGVFLPLEKDDDKQNRVDDLKCKFEGHIFLSPNKKSPTTSLGKGNEALFRLPRKEVVGSVSQQGQTVCDSVLIIEWLTCVNRRKVWDRPGLRHVHRFRPARQYL